MMKSCKAIIRAQILQQREALSLDESRKAAQIIVRRILSLDVFQSSKNIALYHAFRKEVDLQELWIAAYQLGKKTYFPVIDRDSHKKTMRFLEAKPSEELHLNKFNIKEPHSNAEEIDINDLDCLCIPLVAFDRSGYRLGMGQGYYDRALASATKRPYCVGVAYSFQQVDLLPHDPWDISLNQIVTERGSCLSSYC